MRMTILGCAGSMPGPDSACSSYLLEAGGFRLLIDFGTGAVGALQRHAMLHTIDAIVLSHLHPDHCADAASYVVARHYYPPGNRTPLSRPLPRIPLHGPAGTADRITAIGGPGIGSHAHDVYDFCTLLPGQLDIGPFQLTLAHMNHPVETFGMRVEHNGRTLAYSADTGRSDTLVELARDADLFLCEASFADHPDNPPDLHLSGRQAGEHAAKAQARRLVLTHLVPAAADPTDILAEANEVYDGPIEQAHPGWVYEV